MTFSEPSALIPADRLEGCFTEREQDCTHKDSSLKSDVYCTWSGARGLVHLAHTKVLHVPFKYQWSTANRKHLRVQSTRMMAKGNKQ